MDDPAALHAALADFEQVRDDVLSESYYNTVSVARLDVNDDRLRVLKAIEHDQGLMDAYFSVVSGVLSVEDVYTPELLATANTL
ncbi:hypothetical protein ACFQ1S_14580 [Kibdelosporangium lantanae]|uniref:Uncharacterized protein n=1 Tax=Kibdelosporangium lantanae TaxID=1497396 RepID=A0ABW3MCK1_9PSEU